MKYIYNPYGMDLIDPNVIKGQAIAKGSIVTVIKRKFDPSGIFRIIADNKGNIQSVYDCSIKEDRPEYGKQYALTGATGKNCIMNGNSWKESEVI